MSRWEISNTWPHSTKVDRDCWASMLRNIHVLIQSRPASRICHTLRSVRFSSRECLRMCQLEQNSQFFYQQRSYLQKFISKFLKKFCRFCIILQPQSIPPCLSHYFFLLPIVLQKHLPPGSFGFDDGFFKNIVDLCFGTSYRRRACLIRRPSLLWELFLLGKKQKETWISTISAVFSSEGTLG